MEDRNDNHVPQSRSSGRMGILVIKLIFVQSVRRLSADVGETGAITLKTDMGYLQLEI